jgi:SAM-dependent methyltransferase
VPTPQSRKERGSYPTPHWLVDDVVRQTLPPVAAGQRLTVLDPACGDGRFLVAAADHLVAAGAKPTLVGIDVDDAALGLAAKALDGRGDVVLEHGDALSERSLDEIDIVLGNPPFLSQLASTTTRGGASRHGGGPYANAAAEFLAIAVRAVRPGGHVGLVLPQSILASRDAAPVRAEVDRLARRTWSWWSSRPVFDAQVLVCALSFQRRDVALAPNGGSTWSDVVTDALGVPALPPLAAAGTLGERVRLTANFRDQYYALVPAVSDGANGPPLVTSGLIDPGRCRWGERPVTFARQRHLGPRVDLSVLPAWMQRWSADLLVPKVLIANQTRVIEAVADPTGSWLPGVPVLSARPALTADVWPVAAVLTSPVASVWAWHRAAGTGLSADALRLGPRWLAELPWPRQSVNQAVEALQAGDLVGCGREITVAYGLDRAQPLIDWWSHQLPG